MLSESLGVLQAKCHIVASQSQLWWRDDMKSIMTCCIVMHNMMVKYLEDGQEEEVDISDGGASGKVVVGSQFGEMWGSACDEGVALPTAGSIRATFDLQMLAVNGSEYYNTRYLAMERLWKVYGSGSLPD